MLNNIVDNLEQCEQQNIVQCCFHQARTGCAIFAVYTGLNSGLYSGIIIDVRRDNLCLLFWINSDI